MAIPQLVGGLLPEGRYSTTMQEIEQQFVHDQQYAASSTRAPIWADWKRAVALLRSAVMVHRAWVSGSFLTDKLDPNDIDAIFIINRADWAARQQEDKQVVESFINRQQTDDQGGSTPRHGMRVDSYVIPWGAYRPDNSGKRPPPYQTYAEHRGYWDDWWSRVRSPGSAKADLKSECFPARGYVEVSFDAYQ